MDITPLKTTADYRAALKEIENLMMTEFDSLEGEKLNGLVTLVQVYEAKYFPINLPAVKFRMERKD